MVIEVFFLFLRLRDLLADRVFSPRWAQNKFIDIWGGQFSAEKFLRERKLL